jgi:hypothetical protein
MVRYFSQMFPEVEEIQLDDVGDERTHAKSDMAPFVSNPFQLLAAQLGSTEWLGTLKK